MLTAGELASMRATSATALPDSAVIQTQTYVSDGGGGGSVTWAASGTADCRIAPINGTEGEDGGRISADSDYVVTLPAGTAVTTNSRLVISGGTYNVTALRDRSWNLSTRIEVEREV